VGGGSVVGGAGSEPGQTPFFAFRIDTRSVLT
jgi:hypothetical protein